MKNVKIKMLRLHRKNTGSMLTVNLKKSVQDFGEAEELVKQLFPGWQIIQASGCSNDKE